MILDRYLLNVVTLVLIGQPRWPSPHDFFLKKNLWEYENLFFFKKLQTWFNQKLCINGHWMIPYKVGIFRFIWYPRWPPWHDFIFNIEPYGKMNKSYVLETTNMIEPKLYMNVIEWSLTKLGLSLFIWYPRWWP